MRLFIILFSTACAQGPIANKEDPWTFSEHDFEDADADEDGDGDGDGDGDADGSDDEDDGSDDGGGGGGGIDDSDADGDSDSDSDSDGDGGSPGEDEDPEPDPVPGEVVDDCGSAENDEIEDASILLLDEPHTVFADLQLCAGEYDFYTFGVPAHSWASLSIEIDGSGTGSTDIDLYEVDNPEHPTDPLIDYVDESGSLDIVWYSSSEQDYERLAWYNPTSSEQVHTVVVLPYSTAETNYTLRTRTSNWHDERDCDDVFSDTSESGPCNRVMQFPQASDPDQGYLVTHEAHYSNVRREVAYLVAWASAEVQDAFPGTKPLALMDMSEDDGDTPGRMVDSLRHPEGTHVNGNDMDIAYYQTGSDNMGRAVCDNDGYFCTSSPSLLEPRRTAYFMALLMQSPYMRVIGVDTKIAEALFDAADDLRSEGLLSSSDVANLEAFTAYGDGWPFHHHHMHMSWAWESGFEAMSMAPPVDSCEFALDPEDIWMTEIGISL